MPIFFKSCVKPLVLLGFLAPFFCSPAHASEGVGEPLCTYIARIGPSDKFNDQNQSLIVQGPTLQTVALVLRQDRIHFYLHPRLRDPEDMRDCIMSEKKHRDWMQNFLSQGQISSNTIKEITYKNPLVEVTVYSDRVDVQIKRLVPYQNQSRKQVQAR